MGDDDEPQEVSVVFESENRPRSQLANDFGLVGKSESVNCQSNRAFDSKLGSPAGKQTSTKEIPQWIHSVKCPNEVEKQRWVL